MSTNNQKLVSKIVNVEAIPISMPLKKAFKGSNYYMDKRVTVMTRITTEDGIIGEIYNGDELDDLSNIVNFILYNIKPLIIGENIFNVKSIWDKIFPQSFDILADRKIALNSIGSVDSAIYDAIGKSLNMPLVQYWGSKREKLPVMLIGGYYTDGEDVNEKDTIKDIESYIEMGVAGCKFKVGGKSPQVDAERVRIARETAGEDFVLTVDANQGYTRNEAIEFTRLVQDYNIRWFEEPVRWNYAYNGMKDIRNMSGIQVAAGQSEESSGDCIELMKSGSIDVCNFDASWSAGPTQWLRTAAAAEALGVNMAHHEEPQISAHLLGSTSTGTFLEVFHPDRDPMFYSIIENRNPFKNGYYDIPQGPGFGLTLDKDVIEKYRIDK